VGFFSGLAANRAPAEAGGTSPYADYAAFYASRAGSFNDQYNRLLPPMTAAQTAAMLKPYQDWNAAGRPLTKRGSPDMAAITASVSARAAQPWDFARIPGIGGGYAGAAGAMLERLSLPVAIAATSYQLAELVRLGRELVKARKAVDLSERGAARMAARLRAAERLRESELAADRGAALRIRSRAISPPRTRAPDLPVYAPPAPGTAAVPRALPSLGTAAPATTKPVALPRVNAVSQPQIGVRGVTAVKNWLPLLLAIPASVPFLGRKPRAGSSVLPLPLVPSITTPVSATTAQTAVQSQSKSCECKKGEAPKREPNSCTQGYYWQEAKGTRYSVWKRTDCAGHELDTRVQRLKKVGNKTKRYLKRLAAWQARVGVAKVMGKKPPGEPTVWVRGKKKTVREVLLHRTLHTAVHDVVGAGIEKITGISTH
jgi:hypothetical protein